MSQQEVAWKSRGAGDVNHKSVKATKALKAHPGLTINAGYKKRLGHPNILSSADFLSTLHTQEGKDG
jgi:hypothetical protein